MKINVLDAATLGNDLDMSVLSNIGEVCIFDYTDKSNIIEHIADAEVLIINKIKLNSSNLPYAKKLKLICIAATGYDNIDIDYCKSHSIAVCNVVGYSSNSVAQITLSMALSLISHIEDYKNFVRSGRYTESMNANCLSPVYHEIAGMTWGIIGYGNIGKQVAKTASALGCNIIANRRTPFTDDLALYTDIDALCKNSDIISIHTPLNSESKNLIDSQKLHLMKKNVILINVARGAVIDEMAVTKAICNKQIGAFGCDVYSEEPFGNNHPFTKIMQLSNVCLTPHMAWGAYEARVRCLDEIIKNIKCFYAGTIYNRVDI